MKPRRISNLVFGGLLLLCSCTEEGASFSSDLSLSPQPLEFGQVSVGQQKVLPLILKNRGAETVAIQAARFVGASGGFSVQPPPQSLRGLGQVELQVTFKPTEVGPAEARFVVTAAEGDRDVASVIRGTGVAGSLTLSPTTLDFGRVAIGDFTRLKATLTNELDTRQELQPSFGSMPACPAPAAAAFCHRGLSSAVVLQPGESVEFQVDFRPAEVASTRGVLDLCDALGCSARLSVNGVGVEAALGCSPERLAFDPIVPGECSTQPVVCTNNTDIDVMLTAWGTNQDSDPEFIASNPDTLIVSEASSLAFDVQYCPTALGRNDGQVVLTPERGADIVVPLSGISEPPAIAAAPQSLDFGTVSVLASNRRNLSINNIGIKDVEIRGFAFVPESLGFSVIEEGPFALARGELTSVTVEAAIRSRGPVQAEMLVLLSGRTTAALRIPLTAEGVALPPCSATLGPNNSDFGDVEVKRSHSRFLQVQNTGVSDCLVSGIRVLSTTNLGLRLNDPSPATIAPGDSAIVRVDVTVAAPGPAVVELEVSLSDPGSPQRSFRMEYTGATGPLYSVLPQAIDFGRRTPGCGPETRTVSVRSLVEQLGGTVDSIRFVEPSPAFELVLPALPDAINGANGLSFDVRFVPGGIQEHSALIEVSTRRTGSTGPANRQTLVVRGTSAVVPETEERFVAASPVDVDVLFVLDHSGTGQEVDALGNNFLTFIELWGDRNYEVGVTSLSNQSPGELLPLGSASQDRIVTPSSTPTPAARFASAARTAVDRGGRQGLKASLQALSAPLNAAGNSAFGRSHAELAVVILDDGDDRSTAPVSAYVEALQAMKSALRPLDVSVSAISGQSTGCNGPDGNATASLRYDEAVRRTGGLSTSICPADWAQTMRSLGDHVFDRPLRLQLRSAPAPESVRVFIGGVEAPTVMGGVTLWRLDQNIQAVVFTEVGQPAAGSALSVRYSPACAP